MYRHEYLTKRIRSYLEQPNNGEIYEEIIQHGLIILPVLREFLIADLPIDKIEQLESILKSVLRPVLTSNCSGHDARKIAYFQKSIGFILKFKSYTVKASNPLGYSIFLHNEREGFSFQRHLTHKTEVFHILDVMPGGFVFLCNFDDWSTFYDERSCNRWLAGEPNDFFDQHKFIPEPGDVFVVSELGIVHTVIGCVLEEYATISTDMVDRLHDQNRGKLVPSHFNRDYVHTMLHKLELPKKNRFVNILSRRRLFKPLQADIVQGGYRFILNDSFVTASRYILEPYSEGAMEMDNHCSMCVRIFRGAGTIFIADDSELNHRNQVSSQFEAGDLFLIPPGIYYGFRNESSEPLEYSEHRILPEVALI